MLCSKSRSDANVLVKRLLAGSTNIILNSHFRLRFLHNIFSGSIVNKKIIEIRILIRDMIRKLKCQLETYNSNANSKSLRTQCGATTLLLCGDNESSSHFRTFFTLS